MKKINWRYTIGEILIVIVGITIAFSLNNWKTQRVNSKLKKQYLENLIIDIDKEIEQLEQNVAAFDANLQAITELKPYLGKPGGDRKNLIFKVFQIAQLTSFNPENTTYLTLINSGDMSLIKDFSLRRSIEEHYRYHKAISLEYLRLEKIHEKYLGDLFIFDLDWNEIRQGETDFLDIPKLNNIITSIEGTYGLIQASNQKCIESNRQLKIKIINQK